MGIVSAKVPEIYNRVFDQHGTGAVNGMMIGNSMKSDVNPMIEAGGWVVYVPHGLEWEIEYAEPLSDNPRYKQVHTLEKFPNLMNSILKG